MLGFGRIVDWVCAWLHRKTHLNGFQDASTVSECLPSGESLSGGRGSQVHQSSNRPVLPDDDKCSSNHLDFNTSRLPSLSAEPAVVPMVQNQRRTQDWPSSHETQLKNTLQHSKKE